MSQNRKSNYHSIRILPAVFKPGFLVCLSRCRHKRLFQKLPKTRLLCCDMFLEYRAQTVGQFLRLCHHLLRHTRKPVNETCKGHTDAATVFIYTLRDTGNLRLWYIKKISFLRHGYHLRSYSYSYSFIFQIHWVKFKDCFSKLASSLLKC